MSVKKEELIEKICECLFADVREVGIDTRLEDLEGWDSVGRLSIAVLLSDLLCIKVDTRQLKSCQTIGDIMAIGKGQLED